MRFGLKDYDWGYVGAKLAQSDDNAQTEFFKRFIKECKTWGTNYQIEMQLLYVRDKLTIEERELLNTLTYEKEED